jgi:hypothetical protein
MHPEPKRHKYYDPAATLSDDLNNVFDPEKDFPAVTPAGSI